MDETFKDDIEVAMRDDPLLWIEKKAIVNEKGRLIQVGPDSPHFFLEAL